MQKVVVAISGVKNSGKTTLIEGIIPYLIAQDYRVGVIKHDGHSFVADTVGTDSYRYKRAGAFSTIVYDDEKMLMVRDIVENNNMLSYMDDVDIVILEGGKDSEYPKIEVIRSDNSKEGVCNRKNLIAYYTDIIIDGHNCIPLGDINSVVNVILEYVKGVRDAR